MEHTFKELLALKELYDIATYKLVVADEVNNYFDNNILDKEYLINDYDFEVICGFIYDWILNSDYQPYNIMDALYTLLFKTREITFEDIIFNDSNVRNKVIKIMYE